MYSDQHYYYVPYYNDFNRTAPDTHLLNAIHKAINGEYSAVACYEKLAKMAPTQDERNQIVEIQKDEKRHLAEFSRIYANLTGRQPSYQINEGCPDNYSAGIEFAFKDEQETVDFYLDISDKAQDLTIKERFRRAASDEQNHAVWFLFFIQNNPKVTYTQRQIDDWY